MSDVAERWTRLRALPELVAAAAATEPGGELAAQSRLRDRFPADLVPLAFQLTEVRRRAVGRFANPETLWADSVALEQATSEHVARHKAARFAEHGQPVADLCCGMGSDAVAIARSVPVDAYDIRPEALLFTKWNAEANRCEQTVRTHQQDVTTRKWSGVVHFDPDRRPDGKRVRRLEDYRPALRFLQEVARTANGALKLSPASNFGGKFNGCEAELIAVERECREATIWFGAFAGTAPYRATVLTGDARPATLAGDPLDAWTDVSPLDRYLLDPNPALVRSGLLDLYCEQSGTSRLDDAEEYLTAEALPSAKFAPFVTAYRVIDTARPKPKTINRLLRDRSAGHVEVKTRRVPVDANALERKLSDRSDPNAARLTLFYARLAGKTEAILTERVGTDRHESASAVGR